MPRKEEQFVFPTKGGPSVCATCGRPIVMTKDLTHGHHVLASDIDYGSLFDEGWMIDSALDQDHPVLYLDSFLPKNDPRYPDKYQVGNRVRWRGTYGTVIEVDPNGPYGLIVTVRIDKAGAGGDLVLTPGLDPFWGAPKR